MSKKFKRYFIRPKEARKILKEASERLKLGGNFWGADVKVELVEADNCQFYLVDGKPLLVKLGEAPFPTLFFDRAIRLLPKIVVDMGAVPHVCNGANIMAPGVVRLEGEFHKGDLVVVVDERHGKPLALGESLIDSSEFTGVKRGAVVRNIHFAGDKVWILAKSLMGTPV